jgi:hypothetical protein
VQLGSTPWPDRDPLRHVGLTTALFHSSYLSRARQLRRKSENARNLLHSQRCSDRSPSQSVNHYQKRTPDLVYCNMGSLTKTLPTASLVGFEVVDAVITIPGHPRAKHHTSGKPQDCDFIPALPILTVTRCSLSTWPTCKGFTGPLWPPSIFDSDVGSWLGIWYGCRHRVHRKARRINGKRLGYLVQASL